jgi:acyl-CoA thioesterase
VTAVNRADPQAVAEHCARAMWAGDQASARLGMAIEAVGPGTATLSMTVTDAMVNGHGIAHGGFLFTLADSAFAFACNSRGPFTVAAQCHVAFLKPVRLGDRLVATAREVHLEGRAGIYDVRVTRGDETVAEFRGHSRTTGGSWLDQRETSRTRT